jgi:hypothetical protein
MPNEDNKMDMGVTGWFTRNVVNISAVTLVCVLLSWLLTSEAPRVHNMYADEMKSSRDSYNQQLEKNRSAFLEELAKTRTHEEIWQAKLVESMNKNKEATLELTYELRTTRKIAEKKNK